MKQSDTHFGIFAQNAVGQEYVNQKNMEVIVNYPSNDQVQRFMAKLLGYKRKHSAGKGREYWLYPDGSQHNSLPNWPSDRNASYDLPVENQWNYADALSQLILSMPDDDRPIWDAYTESLAWILYKGYKWDNKKEEFLHD